MRLKEITVIPTGLYSVQVTLSGEPNWISYRELLRLTRVSSVKDVLTRLAGYLDLNSDDIEDDDVVGAIQFIDKTYLIFYEDQGGNKAVVYLIR